MDEMTEIAAGLEFPEGPIALLDGSVLVCEIRRGTLSWVTDSGNVAVAADLGGGPNGAAAGPDGAVYVCNDGGYDYEEVLGLRAPSHYLPADHSGGRIERVDLRTGEHSVLYTACDGHDLISPNDLVFDHDGGMWFTDHSRATERSRAHGGLYYATPHGSMVKEVAYPLDAPNGVGLSPDGSRVYVAETYTGRVWWWDIAGPGEVRPPDLPLLPHGGTFLAGLPGLQLFDSLAVEEGGNVVVATIGLEPGLTVISPAGDIVEKVPTPDPFTTNVCFGGDDRQTAYVTLSGTGRLVSMPWARPGLAPAFEPLV